MEMNNIMVLNQRPVVVKNIPLYSLLFKQCPSAQKRVEAISQLILDYIYGENEAGALEVLSLLWPSILEMTVLGADSLRLFTVMEGKDAHTLYSLDLNKKGAVKLDEALLAYAKCLDDLVLKTFAWLKPGIRVPEEFIESASKEMARAAHIMSDPKASGKLFGYFIGRLVGYHYPVESCGLMKKAPRILKESFQNLPEREGQSVAKNLLEYMLVLHERFAHEDGRAQCEVLDEVSRAVGIGLCYHLNPNDVRTVFISAIKSNMKGQ
jgi:hypothetical protein